jgi:hypothetical protein
LKCCPLLLFFLLGASAVQAAPGERMRERMAGHRADFESLRSDINSVARSNPASARFEACREALHRGAEKLFRDLDRNHDQRLSRRELEDQQPYVAQNFREIDTNHNGSLSEREFQQAGQIIMQMRRDAFLGRKP